VQKRYQFEVKFGRNEGYSSNVPDEDYSSNVSDEGYSSNVPDEGYSRNASCALILISTLLCPYPQRLMSTSRDIDGVIVITNLEITFLVPEVCKKDINLK
jgi:hypothetical protein